MEAPTPRNQWKAVKRTLAWSLCGGVLLCGALSFSLWGGAAALVAEGSLLCLALGFWVTEMLVGVFTRVKKANATAIAFLFLAKLTWWAVLFSAAKRLPQGSDGPVALGIGTFLLALLFSTMIHFGMPQISDAETPPDP